MLIPCVICKTEFYINPAAHSRGRGKYCSSKCSGIASRGVPIHRKTLTAMEHFVKNHVQASGCWLWTGTILSGGYGVFVLTEGRLNKSVVIAHRFAYEVRNGKIPRGLHIDHLCRVRHCVNPDHLEAVTPRENVLRGIGISANNARKTKCKRGHEFTKENTRMKKGSRICIECSRAADRKYYRQSVAA